MSKTKFSGHETFYIRKGWLSKGLRNVNSNEAIFINSVDNNSMDILGIGANMVKSLRYWLKAVGLTEEPKSGKRYQRLTTFGEDVLENDPYIEEIGTLQMLHYHLATNYEMATSWYYFFNEFNLSEFTKEDFITEIKKYLKGIGVDVNESSIEKDFICIINSYVPRSKVNPEKIEPENNIDCPLGEIGLIDIVDKKQKIYKKSAPLKEMMHPLIAFATIIGQIKEEKEIRISELLNESGSIGRIFNLDVIMLTSMLHKLELLGYIKVIRTAGLDVIRIIGDENMRGCIIKYYNLINE